MAENHPNILLVEDLDTQGVAAGIMKNYLEWGKSSKDWPVLIKGREGKSEVLKLVEVEKKASELKRLGIIVDADESVQATWEKIAGFCRKHGQNPPATCPKEGYITVLGDIRFGAWIMPNNELTGMLENFCHELVPDAAQPLLEYAGEATIEAKKRGANFPDGHIAKAHIRTWLAWQSIPGVPMGTAISSRMLNHKSESADAFVQWFLDLFELTAKAESETQS